MKKKLSPVKMELLAKLNLISAMNRMKALKEKSNIHSQKDNSDQEKSH